MSTDGLMAMVKEGEGQFVNGEKKLSKAATAEI